jgi:hypothetical protein
MGWSLTEYRPDAWEYRAVTAPGPAKLAETLTRLGRRGWRLVGAVHFGPNAGEYTAYMERPAALADTNEAPEAHSAAAATRRRRGSGERRRLGAPPG